MAENRIFVQASMPATLNRGAARLTDYRTLFETVMAWHKLPLDQKEMTTVEVLGGAIYYPKQIDRLYMGPYSATTMKA